MQHNVGREYLKTSIKQKFGTLKKFCELTGESYDKLRSLVSQSSDNNRASEIIRMIKLCSQTEVSTTSYELTAEQCETIKKSVQSLFGSLSSFSKQHRYWSESGISDLVNGRRKRKSDKVKALVSDLISGFASKGTTSNLSNYEHFLAEQLKQII